ncbi:glycosyltransferase [Priestia megaterium]|uniref:glycosyltransferase n=1 Tax=Priestia megaterium TaxID=1404 RepID=UPI00207A9096|nr:glycosyltransferase [Priestia megaterium]USL45765.1 glycosyltransferase [Priestia megaterium]
MKISVVMPFYNCPYIDQAIQSVLNQTYTNIEILVVSDGSTDYLEKVTPFLDRIRFIEKENGGTASALNMGIQNATGDYISWLSSDDIFYPEKTEIQLKTMLQKNSFISYTNYVAINEKNEFITPPVGEYFPNRLDFLKTMKERNIICGCTILIHRKIFSEIGLFDTTLPYTHDYDLWLRILQKYSFDYLPSPLVQYRVHPNMGTKKYALEIEKEIKFVQKKHIDSINDAIVKHISNQ